MFNSQVTEPDATQQASLDEVLNEAGEAASLMSSYLTAYTTAPEIEMLPSASPDGYYGGSPRSASDSVLAQPPQDPRQAEIQTSGPASLLSSTQSVVDPQEPPRPIMYYNLASSNAEVTSGTSLWQSREQVQITPSLQSSPLLQTTFSPRPPISRSVSEGTKVSASTTASAAGSLG
eukprot:GSA25T00012664001.1